MYDIITIDRRMRGYTNFFIDAEKTAVFDVGMNYDAPGSISALKALLNGRRLDHIILSHSHYDHIGALPEYRKAFPEACVVASEKCASVFEREGARRVIRDLSDTAEGFYLPGPGHGPKFDVSGLVVDRTVGDGDEIDLGNAKFRVYMAPGHTDCSMVLFEPERGDLLLCESTGVFIDDGFAHMAFLKGFKQCLDSIDLCDGLNAERIFVPHFGEYRRGAPRKYFELCRRSMDHMLRLITDAADEGMSDDEIMQVYIDRIYRRYVLPTGGQPKEAFLANAWPMLETVKREFPEHFGKNMKTLTETA